MGARLSSHALYRCLDTVGDGTGDIDMAVNGAVTPVIYMIKPAAGESFSLKRMLVVSNSAAWARSDQYGNAGTLTNGIQIYVGNTAGIVKDYTAQRTLHAWSDWGLLAGSDIPTTGGIGADCLSVRWTFAKGYVDIELSGDGGDYLAVKIQDDLGGLIDHYIMVQGRDSTP